MCQTKCQRLCTNAEQARACRTKSQEEATGRSVTLVSIEQHRMVSNQPTLQQLPKATTAKMFGPVRS
ncbi:hypothetical protein D3C71_25240 [compost metagenome]